MTNQSRSFSALFENWFDKTPQRDTRVYEALKESYRAAWSGGDLDDRICVLNFLLFGEVSDAAMIMTALRDGDDLVALHAEGVATELIRRGLLGSELREPLETLRERFPNRPHLASYALLLLSKKQS